MNHPMSPLLHDVIIPIALIVLFTTAIVLMLIDVFKKK